MGKCSNAFFSETTSMIKAKLYMNVHNVKFVEDHPMNIHVQFGFNQNASSLKALGQLKPNCPGMIIARSSTKFRFSYADRKSRMAATAGHRLTLDICREPSNEHSCLVWNQSDL
jgi:hypothetical protein